MNAQEFSWRDNIISTQSAGDVISQDKLFNKLNCSQNALSCLLLSSHISWFLNDGVGIGFFVYKKYCISIGGMLGPTDKRECAIDHFLQFCKQHKLTPLFVHISEEEGDILSQKGYCVNYIGKSFALRLRNLSFTGKRYQQLRYKIKQAIKAGVTIENVDSQQLFEEMIPYLDAINKEWVKGKSRKELYGLVTDFDSVEMLSGEHRLYIAWHNNKIVAYIIYTRTRAKHRGWYHNLSRRLPMAPDGTMQLINHSAIEDFRTEGEAEHLHFGFTPLVKPDEVHALKGSILFHQIVKWLANRGGVFYPAQSQQQYKMSWRPDIISSEYLAFPKNKMFASLWFFLKATRCV